MANKFPSFLLLFFTAVLLLDSQAGWPQVRLDANNNIQINTTNQNDVIIVDEKGGRIHVLTQVAGAGPRLNAFPANRVQHIYIRTFGGDDWVFQISSKPVTILTYDGNDSVLGGKNYESVDLGENNDIAYTQKGDDMVDGEEHQDFIILGPNDDSAFGGSGNDLILGQGGDDLLILGMEGRDILAGGAGVEDIRGNEGDDFLFGGPGKDELFGLEDNDILCGGTENDQLAGGTGDDKLWGEAGADHHDGEAGNDTLYGNPVRGDTFANGAIVVGDFVCGEQGGEETPPPVIETIFLEDELLAVSDGAGYLYVSGTADDDVMLIQAVENGVVVSHQKAGVEEKLFGLTRPPDVVIQGRGGDDKIEALGKFSRLIVDGGEGNDTLSLAKASYDSLITVDDGGDDGVDLGAGMAFVATEPGNDQIHGGTGTRYIANAGLAPNDDPTLVLLNQLDWPAVEIVEEEDSLKKLVPLIVLIIIVLVLAFFRFKPKQGS